MSRGKPCFISIHAPRTGSDPCSGVDIWLREISIHAPRTGSDDFLKCRVVVEVVISIHAPRTGSDVREADVDGQLLDFNPRSPHGERQQSKEESANTMIFQSTLPARGATSVCWRCPTCKRISIHAPRTGSDNRQHHKTFLSGDFNPRSPHGERRSTTLHGWRSNPFQSTLPARGATFPRLQSRASRRISIHAPRTGSDDRQERDHPDGRHFNPRSPHGERQKRRILRTCLK